MKNLIFILFLSISGISSFGQIFFKDGYLVTNEKDTLWGQIQYGERRDDNTSLIFQDKNTKQKKQFSIKDCSEFGFTSSNELYKRWVVKKFLNYKDLMTFEIRLKDSVIVDSSFLRLLYKGSRFSLYYQYHYRDHFFLYDSQSDQIEDLMLVYQPYKAQYVAEDGYNNASISVKMYFRNQLLFYIDPAKDRSIYKRIDNCAYQENDLIAVLKMLNGESKTKKNKKAE